MNTLHEELFEALQSESSSRYRKDTRTPEEKQRDKVLFRVPQKSEDSSETKRKLFSLLDNIEGLSPNMLKSNAENISTKTDWNRDTHNYDINDKLEDQGWEEVAKKDRVSVYEKDGEYIQVRVSFGGFGEDKDYASIYLLDPNEVESVL